MDGVPVGEHRLVVESEGFQPYAGAVEVREDGRLWAEVDLSPTPRSPLRDDVLISGGVALALLAGGGLFTALTATSHQTTRDAQQAGQAYLASLEETNRFAVTADLLWLAGGAATLTTLVLFLVHLGEQPGPSTATIRRDAP